jgi:putative spermidine/putrescine transport system ATP-binding protein
VASADGAAFTYTAGGGRYVQAAPASPVRVGAPVLVALRPEKLRIAAQRVPDGANRVGGEIATWNYYGTNFHFLVRTDSLGELMVTAPAWRCQVEPEIGRRVELGWSDDASVVVADD